MVKKNKINYTVCMNIPLMNDHMNRTHQRLPDLQLTDKPYFAVKVLSSYMGMLFCSFVK